MRRKLFIALLFVTICSTVSAQWYNGAFGGSNAEDIGGESVGRPSQAIGTSVAEGIFVVMALVGGYIFFRKRENR